MSFLNQVDSSTVWSYLSQSLGPKTVAQTGFFGSTAPFTRPWSRIGHQPRVNTYGQRKTAHLYGAISLNEAEFTYQFSEVFNGQTFLRFLKRLIAKYRKRKVFLIIDNGPCHNLDANGKLWLGQNRALIQLFRLPPYERLSQCSRENQTSFQHTWRDSNDPWFMRFCLIVGLNRFWKVSRNVPR